MIKYEKKDIIAINKIIKRIQEMANQYQKIMIEKKKNHDELLHSQKQTFEQSKYMKTIIPQCKLPFLFHAHSSFIVEN